MRMLLFLAAVRREDIDAPLGAESAGGTGAGGGGPRG